MKRQIFKKNGGNYQMKFAVQTKAEKKMTGNSIPNSTKSNLESLSGYNLDDVRVHYNSPMPAQMQALAYTQGTDVHVAPGQEEHLPHELWHVVQQKQGRVQPTVQQKGVGINNDPALEREADEMGAKAVQRKAAGHTVQFFNRTFSYLTWQRPQPRGEDGLGDPDEPRYHGYTLQRDHIIPYDRIRKFADIVFNNPMGNIETKGNQWLNQAAENFKIRSKEHPHSLFYQNNAANRSFDDQNLNEFKAGTKSGQFSNANRYGFSAAEYEDVLHKAIAWMPGNIFMAPHPKKNDPGNGFDTTAAGVTGLKAKYELFQETDRMMQTVIATNQPYQKDGENALKNLAAIARLRTEPWPFRPGDWHQCPDNKWEVNT